MNYQKVHDSIILKAKSENRRKHGDCYYERHHILPKCLGGENTEDNLVLLTAREHYVIHKLLREIYPKNKKLMYAVHRMMYSINKKNHKRDYAISSREYERMRKECSKAFLGSNNPMYGKTHTKEAALKISETHLGRKRSKKSREKQGETVSGKGNHMYGKKRPEVSILMKKLKTGTTLSEEHKKNIGAKQKGENNHFYGKSHKKESLIAMSESLKKYYKENGHPLCGKKHTTKSRQRMVESSSKIPRLTCPHCGVSSNPGNASRWHFNNCRNKK